MHKQCQHWSLLVTYSVLVSFFGGCDRGAKQPTAATDSATAPSTRERLTAQELIYDRGTVGISELVREDVATNRYGAPAGCKGRFDERLGEQVDAIAGPLKKYVATNKKFPARIESLHPHFIKDEVTFWIHYDTPGGPRRTRLVLLPPATYTAPDSQGLYVIAFTVDPIPMGGDDNSRGRMVIDSNFNTWFVGEAKFLEFLCGRDVNDGQSQPPLQTEETSESKKP